MAEAQREGGVYRMGAGDTAKWVDANGKATDAPAETQPKAVEKPDGAYPYADVLSTGGFKDWTAVSGATDEQILALDGIGPARLAEIRAYKP